ncbi:T9SS sorting signal type C domain-containing protein [Flavobacterium artemisiae]|uniref:T9SS sorting signal type C domain-containing protein n=1 Tax=Flavobacterium artemisiae TaxID=2126556 RepID=A0ABW4H7Q6_9FLAO
MKRKLLYSFFFFIFLYTSSFAQKIWTGATNSDWNTATNWNTTGVPALGDAVQIPSVTTYPVVTATTSCASITFTGNVGALSVNNGVTLTTGGIVANSSNSSSRNVSISGLGTLSATSVAVGLTSTNPSSNIITVLTSTISRFNVSNNLTLNSRSNNSGNRANNAGFLLESGTLDINGQIITSNELGNNTSTFSMDSGAGSATLLLGNATPFNLSGTGNNTIDLNGSGSTVNYDRAGNQSVLGTAYRNIISSESGDKTLSATITVNNDLFVSANTRLIDNAYQITGNTNGNLTVEGNAALVLGRAALVPGTNFPTGYTKLKIDLQTNSKVLYTGGSGTQTISYVPDYYDVECQYPAGKATSGAGVLNINGDFTTASNLNLGNATVNVGKDFRLLGAGASVTLTSGVFSIKGNFSRDTQGLGGTISPNGGTVVFNGSVPQSITGAGSVGISFYNLNINNTSGGVTLAITSGLSDDVTVANSLTLTSGILTTSTTNLLDVTANATTAISGGSSTSFVNGPLKWSASTASTYIFPMGKGNVYLPFTLTNSAAPTSTPTAQVEAFLGDCGGTPNGTSLASLSNTEYWSLITTGNFSNTRISLSRPTAISPLDAIGGSTAVGGTYNSLGGTVGTNGVTSSSNIGSNRFFALARIRDIVITSVNSPLCAGSSFSIAYTLRGPVPPYVTGNTFTAQLSNASGSFASPTNIGSVTSTASGSISVTIPSGTTTGTGYKIRIVSSNPVITGSEYSSNLTIYSTFNAGAINTVGETICYNGNPSLIGNSITPAGGDSSYTYKWQANGSDIPGSNSSTYDPPAGLIATTVYRRFVNDGTCNTTPSLSTGTWTVTVNPIVGTPAFSAGSTSSRCQGAGPVTYGATATNSTGIAYTLDATSSAAGNTINASSGAVTYTASWSGTSTITATAAGCGGPLSSTHTVTTAATISAPIFAAGSTSSRCQGTGSVTYGAAATNSTGITYTLDATSSAAGNTINASSGAVTYTASWSGTSTITATAAGCGGPLSGTHTVTTAATISAPLFAGGSTSSRCQGAGSVTYGASATNATGINYSLDATSSAAGNTINASTGAVSYVASWSGTSTITVTATGCGGPLSSTHTVTVNVNPSTPIASVTTQPNCGVPTGTITVTSPAPAAGINYSIDGSNYTNADGIFTGVTPGSYTVSVRNSSGCITPMAAPLAVAMTGSKVWSGATDTNWSTATNWTPNGVPNDGDCVVIPDLTSITNKPAISGTGTVAHAYTLLVADKSSLTVNTLSVLKVENEVTVLGNGSLVFEDKSSLVQTSNNSNTGNITYKRRSRPVRRYDFTYWSAPIYNIDYKLKTLSPATLGDKYYYYDVANAAWKIDYNGIKTMDLAQGYSVRAPQTYDINGAGQVYDAVFTGVPNNGTISAGTVSGKWNLIGNPYPSAFDAEDFIKLNLTLNGVETGALYFWTHKALPSGAVAGDAKYNYTSDDYAVFNLSGGTVTIPSAEPVDSFIGSGQAFFLKPTGTNSVTFTNAMRDQNNSQFFKTAKTSKIEKNRLWLNFTNAQGAFKQALVGYIEGATNSIDLNYDATTMSGNTYVDFYSISNAKKLTIQARALPFDNTETIPLGYKTTIAGDFTIAIDHADGFFADQAVYLEDKTTSKIVDLRTGNYTFTSAIGTFTDRFVLRYTDKILGTGDFENLDNTVFVSVKDKSIKVTSSQENIKEVWIYNIGGQDVYNKKKVNATELQITNFGVADQVLLVKVTLENGYTVTKKIVFH